MAHWIIDDHGFAGEYYKCSNCGEIYIDIYDAKKINSGYCPSCNQPINDDETEYLINMPKHKSKLKQPRTNIHYIRHLSPSELAPLLIYSKKVYDWDENLYLLEEHEEHMTSEKETFYSYDDALAHEIEWLNAEYKES